jgi:hypothetical protein
MINPEKVPIYQSSIVLKLHNHCSWYNVIKFSDSRT